MTSATLTERSTGTLLREHFAVAAAAARRFYGGDRRCGEPVTAAEYVRSSLPMFDVAVDEHLLQKATGHTYGQMAVTILSELLGSAAEDTESTEPIELIVLGHAAPDLSIHEMATVSAIGALGGRAEGFAIADHGPATAVTAFDLATTLSEHRGYHRIAVVLLDQPIRPYAPPDDPHLGVQEAWAVAVLLNRVSDQELHGALPLALRTTSVRGSHNPGGPAADEAASRMWHELAALHHASPNRSDGRAISLFIDDQLAEAWPGAGEFGAVAGPPGQPTCSAWIPAVTQLNEPAIILSLDARRSVLTGAAFAR